MPRFVVLEHDYPALHWDLMLESGTVLKTWRLAQPPQPGQAVPAEPSFDHRLAYLDYEGAVSGGRGAVRRWDAGTFSWNESTGAVAIHLQGERLRGRAVISSDGIGRWSLRMENPLQGGTL